MAQYIEYATSTYQATATLAMLLGVLGLLLTAVGVYGVMAYRTTKRTREIGIRVALGAPRSQVVSMILREGARVGLIGVAVGVPLAMAATRLLATMLFGVGPWDIATFAAVTTVLALTVGAATLIPALSATRVDRLPPCERSRRSVRLQPDLSERPAQPASRSGVRPKPDATNGPSTPPTDPHRQPVLREPGPRRARRAQGQRQRP